MVPFSFTTPRTARHWRLGEPGPAVGHVWVCLHDHGQPVADFARQLRPLAAPERLLLLPEALSRYELPSPDGASPRTGAAWFAPGSLLPDLADLGAYLDALAAEVLAACPPGTPLTVFGSGHGAAAACRWLAGNGVDYARLVLYAAVFPAEIDRRATLVALPERPVLVVSPAPVAAEPEAADAGLMQDLLDVGLSARQHLVEAGTWPLAAFGAGPEG